MKNILLIGIGGVYNYGCEAIIRGTVNILKKYDPTIIISYASYNYEYDKLKLSDCDVCILNRNRKKWSGKNIIRKLLSFVKIKFEQPYDNISFVKKGNYDTIFSIGGDIYTLDANNNFNKSLPVFCEKCVNIGLNYIIWGASIGPFEKNKEAKIFYQKHLKKASLIVAREYETIKYLNKIGIKENVKFAPDPAFYVAPEIEKNTLEKNNLLGINLSPLSSLYHYSSYQRAIKTFATSIEKLLDKSTYDILFIPHVFSKNYGDNDLFFLQDIYKLIPDKHKDRISLINEDIGFIGIKKEIINCDFVIAARMHCAINACAAKVPTIFLSYSMKSKGMAKFVYGDDTNVLSLTDFENADQILKCLFNNDYKFENIQNYLKTYNYDLFKI